MKKLSIKMRITLWYSGLMLVLVAVVLGFMALISGTVASSSARSSLMRAVKANMDEVEYDDDKIDVDDDFAHMAGGVTSVVYDANGVLVDGYLPNGFVTNEPLVDGSLRTVVSNGRQYYVYDRVITSPRYSDLWIRGIVAADGSTGVLSIITAAAFVLLPFIVVVAAVIGYQIAKHSFRPIDRITQAANEINEGSDLTKRIQLGEGSDEIHRLADTFDRMFSRLEASFEEERQFTSDVSHELRTPTAVILSQCEYALSYAAAEEDYQEALKTVERQATRMSRLISQLLSFTRLERGVERAAREETDLSELVAMSCEDHTHTCQKGITLAAEIEPGIFASVDRSMTVRLLSNLISNANQYGREGGHIWVRLKTTPEEIALSVSDDGIGIPQECLDKIWNRFYQVDPSRTGGENGSMGLGLSMVSQIARLHGGRMVVQSQLGVGSTFTLFLPLS